MFTTRRWVVAAVLMAACSGCNLLTPVIFIGEPKKKIPAEFDKLAGRRVAVLVWTDQSTRFDYPHARFELATYVGDRIRDGLADREEKVELVDPRDVEVYIEREPGAQIDPKRVGRQFQADFVVFLEVIEFQMRDPEQPQLLRGRLRSAVSVYDIEAAPGYPGQFRLSDVEIVHPEAGPVLMTASNALVIREAAYRMFAEQVARKFYEYTVAM